MITLPPLDCYSNSWIFSLPSTGAAAEIFDKETAEKLCKIAKPETIVETSHAYLCRINPRNQK